MSRELPFEFKHRVRVAETYLKDGALLTASDRLASLAYEIRQAALQERHALEMMCAQESDR